jgi:hypothetical protein
MGNDGGSIPKRSEMVKQQKSQKSRHPKPQSAQDCALTKQPLSGKIVACGRGLLYNRASVIQRLHDKQMPYEFRHIRKLKDLKEVSAACLGSDGILRCRLSQQVVSEKGKYMLRGCGCVLSEQAEKEVGARADECCACGQISSDKPIKLLQSAEEQAELLR